MKVSDYIVSYLVNKGITDVFGYPGGMVTHLMDSFEKSKINMHLNYHEQASSFSACGYAQCSDKPGIAYATSGPGATNLITGICNAYFDSVPTIFITGQVNTFEMKHNLKIRQLGFQETDIVTMVKNTTKYAVCIKNSNDIKYYLDKAFYISMNGRKGPVLLDIPMDIQRSDIVSSELRGFEIPCKVDKNVDEFKKNIYANLKKAKRPCILIGNGIKQNNLENIINEICVDLKIPVVSSMLGFDIIKNEKYNYGFIGAYGHRSANFIISKCDLLITLGTRLDIRQVGDNRKNFAINAQIIRVEIDSNECENKINKESVFELEIYNALMVIKEICHKLPENNYKQWLEVCNEIKCTLKDKDIMDYNLYIERISHLINDGAIITTDVGQNQVWVAQSFKVKSKQKVLFSGGHGAMGYSLPAAIGAYYATNKNVICFCGDGGFQMNIQELQVIARDKLPIKIVVVNNNSLGMIRHFQEMYFDRRYTQTVNDNGYTVPDFCAIAAAYKIKNRKIMSINDIDSIDFNDGIPELIEIIFNDDTYVYPKLRYGNPNSDQEPLLDRELYNYLMKL